MDAYYPDRYDDTPLWINYTTINQSETLVFDPKSDAAWFENIDISLEHCLTINEDTKTEAMFKLANYIEGDPQPASLVVRIEQVVPHIAPNGQVDQVLSGNKRPRPAEDCEIAVLKRVRVENIGFKDDQEYRCSICLDDLANKHKDYLKLTLMPCKHAFHDDCILKWLKTSSTCPICRFDLGSLEAMNERN